MTHSPDANNWDDLIAGYVLGNLTVAEVEILQQELLQNNELRQKFQQYQETLGLLPYTLDAPAPSPNLKHNILDTASRSLAPEIQPDSPVKISEMRAPQQRPLKRWQWLVGGLMTAALIGLGLQNIGLRQQVGAMASLQTQLDTTTGKIKQLQSQLDDYDEVVASLRQPNVVLWSMNGIRDGVKSSGHLLAVPGHSELILVSQQLPTLNDQQIYRFWTVAEGETQPLYCGQFRHDETGTARWRSPHTACSQDAAQFMVTLDAPEDPISSVGTVIMEGEIES